MRSIDSANPENWNSFQKFAFRYLFCYCFLFIFPFPFSSIPLVGYLTLPWNWFATNFVSLMTVYCFQRVPELSGAASGSGDQMFRFIETASYVILSLPITILWTMLDKKRKNYSRLFVLLRLWSLLFVASTMLSYGASKIIPSQFPPLTDWQLSARLGTKSPMGMLWTFMSTSREYTIFTGAVEFTAGLLLAFPATTTLGALLSIMVSAQILALNMCYDVPVKLLSAHLLLLSILIVSPVVPDLLRIFVLHKPVKPFRMLLPFKRKFWNIASWIFVWVFLVYTAVFALILSNAGMSKHQQGAGQTRLAGRWEIVTCECEDAAQRGYIKIWQVISNNYEKQIVVTSKDGQRIYLRWKFSADENSVDITTRNQSNWNAHFDILREGTSGLELKGTICGAPTTLSLAKMARGQEFPLTTRGFHWVQEEPYNR